MWPSSYGCLMMGQEPEAPDSPTGLTQPHPPCTSSPSLHCQHRFIPRHFTYLKPPSFQRRHLITSLKIPKSSGAALRQLFFTLFSPKPAEGGCSAQMKHHVHCRVCHPMVLTISHKWALLPVGGKSSLGKSWCLELGGQFLFKNLPNRQKNQIRQISNLSFN